MRRRRILGLVLGLGLLAAPAFTAPGPAAAATQCSTDVAAVCATVNVNLAAFGGGTVKGYSDLFKTTPEGINCVQSYGFQSGTCSYQYFLYDLGSTPKTRTIYWGSAADATSTTCFDPCSSPLATASASSTLSAHEVLAVTAYFNLRDGHTVVVTRSSGGAVVSLSPPGINCGSSCSWAYDAGITLTLHAIPAAGYAFDGWSGANCTGPSDCLMPMFANWAITATFSRIETPAPTETVPPTPKPSATIPATPVPSATIQATPKASATAASSSMPSRTPGPSAATAPQPSPRPGSSAAAPGATPGPVAVDGSTPNPGSTTDTASDQTESITPAPPELAVAGSTLAPIDTPNPAAVSSTTSDGTGRLLLVVIGIFIAALAAGLTAFVIARRWRRA
ncbi:MAG TPA: hypothetical protein VGM49_07715 [Candidatus Limnocylindrales bacterium]|jgi:hypothetical protein